MSKKLTTFKSTLFRSLPKSSVQGSLYENVFYIDSKLPPEKIWDFVSDTSRMNRAMGLTPWKETEVKGKKVITTEVGGMKQEWVEEPWMWTFPSEITQKRTYIQGLMKEQVGMFKLYPHNGGTRIGIYFAWKGSLFFKLVLAPLSSNFLEKKFREFFTKVDRLGTGAQALPIGPKSGTSSLSEQKYLEIKKDIPTALQSPELFRVAQYLLGADPMNIDRIKPKVLSELLKIDLNALLGVLVTLTKHSYLNLSWEVICPHCRASQSSSEKLSSLKMEQSCASCEADYALSGEDALEVVFKCSPKLRKVDNIMYCAAEPAKKKHILINQRLNKNEMLTLSCHLPPNQYRARTLSQNFSALFVVSETNQNANLLDLNEVGFLEVTVPTSFDLRMTSDQDDTLVIEDRSWSHDRFLAGEALTNIHLRTLIDRDLLQSGVKIDLGEQVILFTDIVSSTPFYKSLGDGKAFLAVQKHYHLVTVIIEKNQGVVVKFIGDAVMAAFTNPEKALKACQQIHQRFNGEMTDSPMTLRASFHRGPVICANINVGLDYFGNTVNLAAKIQKWADSREIALTEDLWLSLPEQLKNEYSVLSENIDEKLDLKVIVLKQIDLDFSDTNIPAV